MNCQLKVTLTLNKIKKDLIFKIIKIIGTQWLKKVNCLNETIGKAGLQIFQNTVYD